MNLNERNGFSLIELMVVVAIIGILAGVGIPKYQQFKAKAVRAQAEETLGSIYKLNQIYFSENEVYVTNTKDADELGLEFSESQRYHFEISGPGDGYEGFTATARSKRILASCAKQKDEWINDATNKITNTVNGLAGCGSLFGTK